MLRIIFGIELANMNDTPITQLGIIEGFFGRSWSWQDRHDYAEFLHGNGYHFYIYAPKSDGHLRKNWQTPWPQETFERLKNLRATFRKHQIKFGIGLSPYEIYLDAQSGQKAQLLKKIHELNQLEPDILCILFDDMRGDLPHLAQIQTELLHAVTEVAQATQIIFCPTYYSFDPVLEKVFGQKPDNYWEDLGKQLDKKIDIFWTGPKVCSEHYSNEHLAQVTHLLQRKPFLWDNYPVNDGAIKSRLLQLRAFNQNHGQLHGQIAGHAVNPMNQPWLSRIPLASLQHAYQKENNYDPEQVFIQTCRQLCGDKLANLIIEDVGLFQDQGLHQLTPDIRSHLIARYQHYAANPYAHEILAWLNNEFVFDPACLTE